MKPIDSEQAIADGFRRLARRRPFLALDVDWPTGFAILAHLQLALRHPGCTTDSTRLVRAFCDALIGAVEPLEPAVAAVMRMGDDPRHDVPGRANTMAALATNLRYAIWCLENPGVPPTPDALANMKAALARAGGGPQS